MYGQSRVEDTQIRNRFNDRFAAALDVVTDPMTGLPVCRSNLDPAAISPNVDFDGFPEPASFTPGPNSGCVPFNVFGAGAASQQAVDFVFRETVSNSEIAQHVVSGFVSATSEDWFELPGGPAGLLLGGEWRRETSKNFPAQADQDGLTFGNVLQDEIGDFEVKEFFAEVKLPLVEGLPLMQYLNLDGAVRVSDYTTVGTTLTWKGGLAWQVIDDLRLRGTIAQAVRAPNIGELFDPGGQDFEFINDPCDISNLDEGEAPRAANCATLLTGLGVDPTTFTDPNSASVAGISRGNPDLGEESARTYTVGAILQPTAIPGLTLSVDWYDITIDNAIITATAQTVADLCVDTVTLNNNFCPNITRDATGAIVDFQQSPLNVAEISTRGIDFAANYQFEVGDLFGKDDLGAMNMRLIGNRLSKLDFINFPGDTLDDDLNEEEAPRYQLSFDATWDKGPFTLNYGFTYFSQTLRSSNTQMRNDPNRFDPQYIYHPALFSHDVQARYRIGGNYQVYVGLNNFTNQKPSIGETFYPVSAVGRFLYAGFRMDFASLSDVNQF